jgi:hypothetical protein
MKEFGAVRAQGIPFVDVVNTSKRQRHNTKRVEKTIYYAKHPATNARIHGN